LKEVGLIDKWLGDLIPKKTKCSNWKRDKGLIRLSFGHLSGAFAILLGGLTFATILTLFIIPAIYTYLTSKKGRLARI
jgi:hypothetical protein